MDETTLKTEVETRLRSLATYLEADDYTQAVQDMLHETGFAFPITEKEKMYWAKERTHRHLLSFLLTESARKFNIKSINLAQRFDHYFKLVEKMDTRWETFIAENPDLLFPGETFEHFGHNASSTWAHDYIGRELPAEPAVFNPRKDS